MNQTVFFTLTNQLNMKANVSMYIQFICADGFVVDNITQFKPKISESKLKDK